MKNEYGKSVFEITAFNFSERKAASEAFCVSVWQNEGLTDCEGKRHLVSYLQSKE